MDEKYSDSYIEQLAHKYKTGVLSEQEQADFDNWYNSHNDTEFQHIHAADPAIIKARMFRHLVERIEEKEPIPIQRRSFKWQRYAVAASILFILSVGGYFLLRKQALPQTSYYKNDIKPGTNQAVLTLANGRKIILSNTSNGVIASQGNTAVSNQAGRLVYNNSGTTSNGGDLKETAFDTLTTPRGGMYHLTLSDGSKMWLNAATSVRYPANFIGKYRTVELIYGEAYYEVIHNAGMPFRVLAAGQTVEDIGTQFNVSAYPDEADSRTTLVEGAVKMTLGTNSVLLKPGEQTIARTGSPAIVVKNADIAATIAWKNGLFAYNNTPLQSLMRQISRWYNVDIVYQSEDLKSKTFSGSLSRYDNVSRMLKSIEFAGTVKFKIEGRKIIITK